jgi:molybdopterin/thiamine biosynthesis adenylyltransferase
MTKSSSSQTYVSYQAEEVKPKVAGESTVFDRQSRVPGFKQEKLAKAKILLIGAGGIGGEIGEGLVRKGIGHLIIADGDVVQLSNLNRQRFYECDLYRNKALALARNLSREAVTSTLIEAYACDFQRLLETEVKIDTNVVICGVDNEEARVTASQYFLNKVPVIFIAVDETADHGYVFIQDKGGRPCYCCLYPDALTGSGKKRCTPVGAVKDILKVVCGIALYAIDTILMGRPRNWSYRHITLAGFVPEVCKYIPALGRCPVCGQKEIKNCDTD